MNDSDAHAHRASRLHPFFVAAPLLAWTASFGFDLASRYGPDGNHHARSSERAMLAGLGAAAVSGAFGLYDWTRLRGKTRAKGSGLIHVALNVVTAVLYGASALRRGAIATEGDLDIEPGSIAVPNAGRVTTADLAGSATMIVLLAAIGAAGGQVAAKTNMPSD